MKLLSELRDDAEAAARGLEELAADAERSVLARQGLGLARVTALYFAGVLLSRLRVDLLAASPTAAGELVAVVDAALESAVETYEHFVQPVVPLLPAGPASVTSEAAVKRAGEGS